jgi:dihydroorotase
MTGAQPDLLFRGALIVDPERGTETPGDLLVSDRRIAAVGVGLTAGPGAIVLPCEGRVLAPAIVDAGVFRADVAACREGGIATAILMPDQAPPLDDPALVERAERLGKPTLWVRPLAAATRGLLGRELGELALMRDAGAVGAATGRSAIADSGIMLRLLRYAGGLGLVTVTHGEDRGLTAGAVATEGEVATRLGLAAAPAVAEAIGIARDLRLGREARAPLHIACVTTAEGADLVRRAKDAALDVTAATTPEAFLLNEMAAMGYRSFARLSPPLRSEADRLAIMDAVADGTIDMITSRHDPRTQEDKRLPFSDAAPGAAGAATLLSLSLGLVRDGRMTLADLFRRLSLAPARRFGLDAGRIDVGAPADLLLFDAGAPWRIEAERLPGIAGNTPFDGLPTAGRVDLLVKGGEIVLDRRVLS